MTRYKVYENKDLLETLLSKIQSCEDYSQVTSVLHCIASQKGLITLDLLILIAIK